LDISLSTIMSMKRLEGWHCWY